MIAGWARRLGPKSMVGQIMLVTALAIFLIQSINTVIRVQAFRGRAVVEASSLVVAVAAHRIDRGKIERPRQGWGRHSVRMMRNAGPLDPVGFRSTEELAERVALHIRSIYPQVTAVRLSVGPAASLPPDLAFRGDAGPIVRAIDIERPPRSGEAVLLSLRLGNGSWVHSATEVRAARLPPLGWVFAETLLIYLGVLIPLLLVVRRIARPLRTLGDRLDTVGLAGGDGPIIAGGPEDVRKLIASFNDAEQRLHALLTEKDVMLGAIGHDLKTPLAAMRVRIESIDDEGERDKMAASIDEMVTILDDILMLARLGKSAEGWQLTDIDALIETVADEISANGEIEIVPAERKTRATVRPVLLRRAIRNLAGNAIKYGGKATIRSGGDADWLDIVIEDEGPGIPSTDMARMFEPFIRADESRNRASGGSGLGLTIARAIARAHGGDVILENRREGGLRACLRVRRHQSGSRAMA